MTDKEFQRLTRAQLIDIIYQLQLNQDKLTEENRQLKAALEDKSLRMDEAGNIAEAALIMNDVFRNAQNAAEQYLAEIRAIRAETEERRQKILADAQAQAQEILSVARTTQDDYDAAVEAVLREYGKTQPGNG
jgi:vacuolar-type H+-ATPase subunit H